MYLLSAILRMVNKNGKCGKKGWQGLPFSAKKGDSCPNRVTKRKASSKTS